MALQFNSLGKVIFSAAKKLYFACCCDSKQWAQNYVNNGCGTCSGGYYSGDWSEDGDPYVLEGAAVQAGSANACVIDSDAGTAVCYGSVYTPAEFPDTSDVGGGPTVTHDYCYQGCGDPYFVYCVTRYYDFDCAGGIIDVVVNEDVASAVCISDGGCMAAPATTCTGCSGIGGGVSNYWTKIAGPVCSQADASAWRAANCGGTNPTDNACC